MDDARQEEEVGKPRLPDLPERIEQWLHAAYRSKYTRRSYRRAFRDLIRHMPLRGDGDDARLPDGDDLLTLTSADVLIAAERFRQHYPDAARKTWNATITAWRTLNRHLHSEGLVDHLAALKIGLRPDVLAPREIPTREQVESMWAILLSSRLWRRSDLHQRAIIRRDRAVFALLVGSALRAGEIAALDVGDFDMDKRLVRIRHAKGDHNQYQPWSDESDRFILPCVTDRRADDIAFHGPRSGRMKNDQLNAVVRRLCKLTNAVTSAGRPFTAHAFRHFAGTYVYELTGDIHLTAIFMRHKNIDTTRRYDAHILQRRVVAPIHLPGQVPKRHLPRRGIG